MLQSIFIQNYALIDKLDIDFTSGFSVITGETGAGKSIILGAIGLLLGQRADVKSIKKGASKCIVEATFQIANYGMENLRFIEPVKPGDTIQVRLTCKRKTLKKQRAAEEKPTGVVEWAVEIFNQHQQAVALYSILTLVARQQGDF